MSTDNYSDEISLDFLENIGSASLKKKADTAILKDAMDYNVNLEMLEEINPQEHIEPGTSHIADIKMVPAENSVPVEDVPVRSGFDKIDVHLKDIIEKIFRSSTRPIVIISNDKIIYANGPFLKMVGADAESKVIRHNFLEYVSKEYWNVVAENIGEALTSNKSLQIGIKEASGKLLKLNFDAVYIPDSRNFSFVLIGEHLSVEEPGAQCLYDHITGLPTYYLLEDRIQVIVNSRNNYDISFGKGLTALIGVSVDNMAAFERLGNDSLILKRLTSRIGLSLNKVYTLARGIKYQFWILVPNIEDYEALQTEVDKVKQMFDEPIEDNFSRYEIKTSIGVSTFPEPATSAKKLMEQSILAVDRARKNGDGVPVIFGA